MKTQHTPGPWRFVADGAMDDDCNTPRIPVPFDFTGPGYYNNPSIEGPGGETVVGCGRNQTFNPMNPTQSDTPTPRTDALPPEFNILSFARQLERELRRVTAERDRYLTVVGEYLTTLATARDEARALRARVAELDATIAELTTDGNAATLAANLAKASKRNAELVEQLKAYGKYAHDTTLEDQNAELVAALRDVADSPNTIISEALYHQIDILLARHRAKQEVKS